MLLEARQAPPRPLGGLGRNARQRARSTSTGPSVTREPLLAYREAVLRRVGRPKAGEKNVGDSNISGDGTTNAYLAARLRRECDAERVIPTNDIGQRRGVTRSAARLVRDRGEDVSERRACSASPSSCSAMPLAHCRRSCRHSPHRTASPRRAIRPRPRRGPKTPLPQRGSRAGSRLGR